MTLWKLLVLIGLCSLEVNCMALNGPGTTWYNPCGLGVIHFDKYSQYNWLGVVHFGLYKHLQVAVFEIQFDRRVRIYWASHNSTVTPIDDEGRGYQISPEGFVPEQYKFYIEIERVGDNETDIPTVTKFALNNLVLCDDAIRASQTVESLSSYDKHVCGRRSLEHSELVSIRTDAKAGNWPWHVAILTMNPVTNKTAHYCGGNIISRTAVLTAGPCVRRKGKVKIPKEWITVVAGVINLRDDGQIGKQIHPVTEVVVHPNYDDELATSAIAILKVERFIYTAFVQPICIWGPIYDRPSLFGKLGMFVGFGDNEKNPTYVLRSTDILVQNDSTCVAQSPEFYGKLINEFTICAGTSTGLRPGDGGGGLVLPVMQADHKMSWFLRGVLSKCILTSNQTECDPNFYVVYTDVGPHFSWIYHHSKL